MKDCIGQYKYKGFVILFVEDYQQWIIQPDSEDIAFVEENTVYPGTKTIAATKKFIKENLL